MEHWHSIQHIAQKVRQYTSLVACTWREEEEELVNDGKVYESVGPLIDYQLTVYYHLHCSME